jgi:hypothetical protein
MLVVLALIPGLWLPSMRTHKSHASLQNILTLIIQSLTSSCLLYRVLRAHLFRQEVVAKQALAEYSLAAPDSLGCFPSSVPAWVC